MTILDEINELKELHELYIEWEQREVGALLIGFLLGWVVGGFANPWVFGTIMTILVFARLCTRWLVMKLVYSRMPLRTLEQQRGEQQGGDTKPL